jgi:hypothetical protein
MQITCACGQPLEIEAYMLGRRARCPACGRMLLLRPLEPEPGSQPAPADESAAGTGASTASAARQAPHLPPRRRSSFLRVVGTLHAAVLSASALFFGIWGIVEVIAGWARAARWGGRFEYYYLLGLISITFGIGILLTLAFTVLAVTHTLARAAGDADQTYEMMHRVMQSSQRAP